MKSCPSCKRQYTKPANNKPIANFCASCGVPLVDVSEPSKAPLRAEPVRAPLAAEPVRAPLPNLPSSASTMNETPTMFADVVSVPRPSTSAPKPQLSGAELEASVSPTMFHAGAPQPAPKPNLQVRAPQRTALPTSPRPILSDPAATTLQQEEQKPAPRAPTLLPRQSSLSVVSTPKVEQVSGKISASLGVPVVPMKSEPQPNIPLVETPPAPVGGSCAKCGTPMPPGFFFCGLCGFDMRTYNPAAETSNDVPTPVPQGPVPQLVLLTPEGKEQARHPLVYGRFVLGRAEDVSLSCPENLFLSQHHALLTWDGQQLILQDLDSFNGIYRKIKAIEPLQSGDCICIGQQFFRFEQTEIVPAPSMDAEGTYRYGAPLPETGARLVLLGMGGAEFDIFYLRAVETSFGRASGDITFSQDAFISRSHAKISLRDGVYHLEDLGSSNGTFLRIRESIAVSHHELLLMGDQLFRIELPGY